MFHGLLKSGRSPKKVLWSLADKSVLVPLLRGNRATNLQNTKNKNDLHVDTGYYVENKSKSEPRSGRFPFKENVDFVHEFTNLLKSREFATSKLGDS